jgi:predicted small secreted protein
MNNKLHLLILPLTALAFLSLSSCNDNDGPGEKIGREIDDALDARPNEGIKDAIEDIGDSVKRGAN